jgi:pyrroloquinoline quinone biosynthesis protein D
MPSTAISESTKPCLTRGVRLEIDSATGREVLLYPEGIVELNETAREILTRCDGRTFREIVQSLAEEYDADVESLAVDVRETVSDLHQRKLIQFK